MAKQIQLHVSDDVLQPGQTITVPITLTLDKPTKARCIIADFHAGEETKADYTTTTTDSEGRSRTETRTATEIVDIAKETFLLDGQERLGFFGRLGDNFAGLMGGGRRTTYEPGEYEFSVDILIPGDAPASFRGEKCRVFYELSVRVDRPMARDYTDKHSFHVDAAVTPTPGEPVVVRYPEDSPPGFWDRLLGTKASLRLALATNVLTAGDTVTCLFQVDDDNEIQMKGAVVRMVAEESTLASGHQDRHVHRTSAMRIFEQTTFGDLSEEFDLVADFGDRPLSAAGKNFQVQWFVEVELDVPWAKNPTIRCPITVC